MFVPRGTIVQIQAKIADFERKKYLKWTLHGRAGRGIFVRMQTLADRIARLRDRLGLSRSKLSEMVDLSERSIMNYESGERIPKATDLVKLSKALGTTVAYLVGEISNPEPSALEGLQNETRSTAESAALLASPIQFMVTADVSEKKAQLVHMRLQRELLLAQEQEVLNQRTDVLARRRKALDEIIEQLEADAGKDSSSQN